MYSIKPFPKISQGAKNGERKREEEKKKIADRAKLKAEIRLEDKKESMEMHSEMVSSIDNNTESLKQALSILKDQVEKISFEIPENDDTKIISAINESAKGVERAINSLNTQIKAIKIEIPNPEKTDMSGVEKSLSQVTKSNNGIGTLLEGIREQMENIEFPEGVVITEWNFTFERDNNHLIDGSKGIKAKAVIDG